MDTMPPEPSHVESDAHSDDNIHVSVGEGATNVAAGKNVTQYIGYSAEQVTALIAQVRTAEQPRTWDGRVPYVGLAAFQEADAEFFFGREELVDTLLERIQETRFLCIAGPSGSGKSSLVQAGLIHALRSGRLAGSRHWLYASLSPRGDPIEQLALAMARVAGKPDVANYLRNRGPTDPGSLQQQAETLLGPDPAQRLILYIDQFEELFTQTRNEIRRQSFLALLTDAIAREDGRVTVILSMRSDFMSQCATYPELLSLINQQFQLVGAMTSQELALAILKPALVVGAEIEPDLVAQVIADMKGEPGALPLMQFALKDLFGAHPHKRGDVVKLALSDYIDRGGIEEALERHANAAFALFDEAQREIARRVFTHLIDVGRGTFDTRRTAAYAELSDLNTDTAGVRSVIAVLTDARLLTTDALEPGEPSIAAAATVTIAHEKLIEAWPWLSRLVNENREAIALQNHIADDAHEWSDSGRDSSYLYTGIRLAAALEQVDRLQITLSNIARDFLDTGRKREEDRATAEMQRQRRDSRRKTWTIRILSSVLGVIALGIAVQGIYLWTRSVSPWQPGRTFPKTPVLSMAVDTRPDGTMRKLCAGTMHIGVACTTDGSSWNILQQGLPDGTPASGGADRYPGQVMGVFGLAIDPADPDTVYAYVSDGYVYKNTGAELRWRRSDTQLPALSAARLTAYGDSLAAVVYTFLTNSDHRFYRSNDGGKTWLTESDPLFKDIRDVAISPDGRAILAATQLGLFRSPLAADLSWSPVSDMPVILVAWEASSQGFWFISSSPEGNAWELHYMEDDAQPVTLAHLKSRPVSLAVESNFGLGGRAFVLLESGDVLQIDADKSQDELGKYSRILPGRAYTVVAAHGTHNAERRLFLGHYDGLMKHDATR